MTMNNKYIDEQAAFIVDKYLSDNNFLGTRYCFRNEASLFAHSPIHEAPKNLMTLNEMLEDYISLKEQKETMDKEKADLKHAQNQVLMLIQIVQNNAMNTYNVSGHIPQPATKSTLTDVPQPAIVSNKSHPGVSTSGKNKLNTQLRPPSSISNTSSRKRKSIFDMDDDPSAPKHHHTLSGRRIPKTSLRTMSSQIEQMAPKETSHCISPVMTNSDKPSKSDHEAVTTSYNAISCKRVMASPSKQMASKETSHCISPVMINSDKPSKSDHEESMLGFESADVPESLANLLFNEISTPASENQFDDLINLDDLFNSDDDDIYKLIDFSS